MASKELTVPFSGDVPSLMENLLSAAQVAVFEKHGNVHDGGPELEAEILFEAIAATVHVKDAASTMQMHLVADVARKQAWQFHPNGYDTLRDFLKDAGLAQSQVSNLTFIGGVLVPYCDAEGIPVDHLLSKDHRAKTRNAIPALRSAIGDNDREKVKEILDDVEKAKNRDAIRLKYRNQRDKYGRGTTVNLPGGRVLLLAVLDDDDAAKTIVQRLSGGIKWELVADAHQLRNSIRTVIDDSGNGGTSVA